MRLVGGGSYNLDCNEAGGGGPYNLDRNEAGGGLL